MEVKFTVTKEERKVLVKAVSEIMGQPSVYKGAPGFEFTVGSYTIDRNGTLLCNEQAAMRAFCATVLPVPIHYSCVE